MKQRIMEDLKSAMKSGDKERLSVIRMLKGAIQMEEIAKMHELTDEEIVPIIAKQIKTRKEANVEFAKANRNDLVDKNNAEIEILNTYMPRMMDEAEKQISYEENFEVIVKLSNYILPIMLIGILIIGIAFQTDILLALSVVSIIYIYILISQYKITKRYYKE